MLALSAPTWYNEEPSQQRDTHLNYARVVASGRGRGEPRRLYERARPRVARNSFSLVLLSRRFSSLVSSLLLFSSPRVLSLARSETNSCWRFDMSLALPGPSFAYSAIYPRLFLSVVFLSFLLVVLLLRCLCLLSPSPSDSRVYSRALAEFLRLPGHEFLIFLARNAFWSRIALVIGARKIEE